jgi:DNA-directed RNA polymerase subunit RPC12/RpoP
MMLLDRTTELVCHECGSPDIEARGCTFAVDPHPRPDPRLRSHRVTRVVEHKYRCQRCGYEFSTVEEF